MLFSYYRETPLEQWINAKCLAHGITNTSDLDIGRIAEAFGVELIYGDHPSFCDNEDRVIFLNKYADDATARVIFFHELCHVLRHAGDQRTMPALFKNAQETEADQFVLYAAVPFYMFARLNIPDLQGEAIDYIAGEFRIPPRLAGQRLEQIHRRVLQGHLLAAAREADKGQLRRQSAWSKETNRVLSQLERQINGKRGEMR